MSLDLHVFMLEDFEKHWVIARDYDDAYAVLCESNMNDDETPIDDYAITRLDDDQLLARHDEDVGRVEKVVREWVSSEGRGFFASTVF